MAASPRPVLMAPIVQVLTLISACATNEPPKTPAGEQTYTQAITLICDVDRAAGIAAAENPLQVEELRTDYLQAHIKNPDGIYFYTVFRVQPPAEQSATLKQETYELGIKECALARTLGTPEEF